MSVKLMAMVFDADIPDLEYLKKGQVRKAKASTVTLVLLAYADHANEYGEGTYPGYKKLLKKTKLSAQGLADTIEALKQNSLLSFEGRSKLNTNSYNIILKTLEEFLKPLEKRDSSHLRNFLKPLEHNHPIRHLTSEEEGFGKVWTFYQNNFHMGGTHDHEKIGDLYDEHGGHWTLEAMKIAVENNKRNIAYFSKILERWKADGYGTTKPESKNGNGYKHVDHPGPDIPLVRATEPEIPVVSLDALRQARASYEKDKAS